MLWLRSLLFALGLCFTTAGLAMAEDISASKVKTAFILNFAKFTQWPSSVLSSPEQNLKICTLGKAVLEGEINALQGRKAGKRQLEIFALTHTSHASTQQCHIVFIGKSEQTRLDELLPPLNNTPILTISDIEQFAIKGGHIELMQQQNNIVFQINLLSLQKNQLKLPGQVLNLATQVIK